MPRPKGSKNKKNIAAANVDYAAQIAEKMSARADVDQQVQSKTDELTALKVELKTLKTQAKSLDKEIDKLLAAQAAQEAAEAEAAKRAELEDVLKKLMADGMSAQEILDKLQ
jgi:septal ring factor EnvC (AmiA/AmiB activator)